ncbi:MAG: tyrosine-type recombinase/integrase [Desulfomonilaceae bacterium]
MGLRKRGKIWYLRLKTGGEEFPALSLCTTKKTEAESIDVAIKLALKDRNPSILNDIERGVIQRILADRVEEFLPGFNRVGQARTEQVDGDLTLYEASEMVYRDPEEVHDKSKSYRERFKHCVFHLLYHLGSDTPLSSIKVKDVKKYRSKRGKKGEGAAPATINKEVGILSKIFRVLKSEGRVKHNPCSFLTSLSTAEAQRQVYISLETFKVILSNLPDWYKPIAELGYYCGMRQGEIWTLTRSQIDLKSRIIRLSPFGTKEEDHKSVPIPVYLAQEIAVILSNSVVGINLVFLRDGVPIRRYNLKRPWEKAVRAAGFPDLTFHDFRHTWRRNARKSNMDPDLRRSIMGHSSRKKSVDEGYDLFDDEDRVEAIDKMTYDHGETRILTPKRKTSAGGTEGGTPSKTENPLQTVLNH